MKTILAITVLLAGLAFVSQASRLTLADYFAADAALQHVVDGLELARVVPINVQYALRPYRDEIAQGLVVLDVATQSRYGFRVLANLVPVLLPYELGLFASVNQYRRSGGINCAWRLA